MRVPSRSTSLAVLVALGLTLSLGLTSGALAEQAAAPAPAPPIKVIQNYSEGIESGLQCNVGTKEVHVLRRFDLVNHHGAAQGFKVSSVVFAVALANSSDGDLPGTVSVFAIDHADDMLLANLEELNSVPVNFETVENFTLMTVPVAGSVPAGKDLVLQASSPGVTAGESFAFGTNDEPEIADDYLRMPPCGVNEPTPVTTVGFPGQNHVIYALGKAGDCLTAEAAVPPAEKKAKKAKKKLKKAKKKLKQATQSGDAEAIEKATKKKKKAKKKSKKAKKALKAAKQKAAVECAQPALPTLTRPSGPRPVAPKGGSSLTAIGS